MLYLKEANDIDFEEEFEYISNLPPDENGFTNNHYGCTKAEFKRILLISFGIKKEYRGNGFSNDGLKLAIQKARSIIPEDEIYVCR